MNIIYFICLYRKQSIRCSNTSIVMFSISYLFIYLFCMIRLNVRHSISVIRTKIIGAACTNVFIYFFIYFVNTPFCISEKHINNIHKTNYRTFYFIARAVHLPAPAHHAVRLLLLSSGRISALLLFCFTTAPCAVLVMKLLLVNIGFRDECKHAAAVHRNFPGRRRRWSF
jgi:hypothetical protein